MLVNDENIIKDDNKLIRAKSKDVPLPLNKEDRELLESLLTYVENSTNEEIAKRDNLKPAVGISAIQVGVPKKLLAIVIRDDNDNIVYKFALANAKIVSESVEKTYLKAGEGCLSVTAPHEGYIYRSNRIKVRAYDMLKNEDVEIKASGYLAVVMQHEIDHFKGILFYDRINHANPFYVQKDALVIE